MNELIIRKATIDDLDAFLNLYKQHRETLYHLDGTINKKAYNKKAVSETFSSFLNENYSGEKAYVLVAEWNDSIVGVINFFVHPGNHWLYKDNLIWLDLLMMKETEDDQRIIDGLFLSMIKIAKDNDVQAIRYVSTNGMNNPLLKWSESQQVLSLKGDFEQLKLKAKKPNAVKFRKAKINDIDEIVSLNQLIWKIDSECDKRLNGAIFDRPFVRRELEAIFRNPDAQLTVAVVDEMIVGYLNGELDVSKQFHTCAIGHLSNLAVIEDYQHQEIGSALLYQFVKQCKKEDISFLTTEVYKLNLGGLKFYQRIGFSEYQACFEIDVNKIVQELGQ